MRKAGVKLQTRSNFQPRLSVRLGSQNGSQTVERTPCQATPRLCMKRKKRSLGDGGEAAWLKKRRRLVNRAVATSASAGSSSDLKVKAAAANEVWCEKQTREVRLQDQRDHVNSSSVTRTFDWHVSY